MITTVGLQREAPRLLTPAPPLLLTACRLAVMAPLAEGLPVRSVPKLRHVAAVRDDVVDHRRRCNPSQPLALSAKRMSLEESLSRLLPPPSISSLGCRPPALVGSSPALLLRLLCDMLMPIAVAGRVRRGLPAFPAGLRGTWWHALSFQQFRPQKGSVIPSYGPCPYPCDLSSLRSTSDR